MDLHTLFFFKDDTFSLNTGDFFQRTKTVINKDGFIQRIQRTTDFVVWAYRDVIIRLYALRFIWYIYIYCIYICIYICIWYIYIYIYYLYVDYVVVLWYVHMIISIWSYAIGIGASSHGSKVITIASWLGWRSPWLFASENMWNLWNNHGLFMVKPSIFHKS